MSYYLFMTAAAICFLSVAVHGIWGRLMRHFHRKPQSRSWAVAFCVGLFFSLGWMPINARAQIIGDIQADVSLETMSHGSSVNGFGLSAMRYEDKQRLKRLRERYLELNPKRKGVVSVYDVATTSSEAATIDEILDAVNDDTEASNKAP